MICVECEAAANYKCPTCIQPYCSVQCCKKHKSKPCSAPLTAVENVEDKSSYTYEFPTEDTVPPEKLKLLEQSMELKKCLENPHVRQILETLDKSPHPDELMQEYMQEPIFTEFVDASLKVIQPQTDIKTDNKSNVLRD